MSSVKIIPYGNLGSTSLDSDFDIVQMQVDLVHYIWGYYQGEESLPLIRMQTPFCNMRDPITGFGVAIGRKGTPRNLQGEPATILMGICRYTEGYNTLCSDCPWGENIERGGTVSATDLPTEEEIYWVQFDFAPLKNWGQNYGFELALFTDANFNDDGDNYFFVGYRNGEYPMLADWGLTCVERTGMPDNPLVCMTAQDETMAFYTITETPGDSYACSFFNYMPECCGAHGCYYNTGSRYCLPFDCQNPGGMNGDETCGYTEYGQDPSHRYLCQNDNWIDQGYDSSCAGDCTNPPGSNGDIICGNINYGQDKTHKYRCEGGTWIDQGYSSECDTNGDCSSPTGNEGDVIECGLSQYGQDPMYKYVCQSGSWVKGPYNPNCGGFNIWPYVTVGIGITILAIGLIKQ